MKQALGLLIKLERQAQNMSQQALCEGICAVSYLSKIETGHTAASMDILKLLLEQLDCPFVEDDTLSTSLTHIKEALWDQFFSNDFRENPPIEYKETASTLIYSKDCLDALITYTLYTVMVEEGQTESVVRLETFRHLMNETQQYQSDLLKTLYLLDHDPKWIINQSIHDPYGWLDYYKMSAYFLQGHYKEAILMSNQTYTTFAKQGNVLGMLHVSELTGSANSNLGNLNGLLEEAKRVRTLNHYVNHIHVEIGLNYNLGSSYLVYKHYDLAIEHLIRAIKLSEAHQEDSSMAHQKIAFTYIFKEQFDKARSHIDKIQTTNPVTLKSVALLQFMVTHPDYIRDKTYITLLEACYNEAKNHNHFGVIQFYCIYLLEAYKKNYHYQKALKMTESLYFHDYTQII